ncbi:hypothetical protein WDH52_21750, partial [Streptomyces sp. TRM70308]|uniref:hypothetical protein n=1 Tax=Streptomyces sp. TRM70308 TaxID=3131932 RepID=UPI003D08F5A8
MAWTGTPSSTPTADGAPTNHIRPTRLYSIGNIKSDVAFVGSTAPIGGFIGDAAGSMKVYPVG